MAQITTFVTGDQEHETLGDRVGVMFKELDFSATNVDSGSNVQALKVGAGMLVLKAGVVIVTAEGSAASCDLGDSADSDGFEASINLNDTAGTNYQTVEGTDAYGAGRYYASADTIDLMNVTGDLTVGKVRVWAIYVRLTT